MLTIVLGYATIDFPSLVDFNVQNGTQHKILGSFSHTE